MYSPAICSIAEIGIGINLALSLVQDFRKWVQELIRKNAQTTALKLRARLAELESGSFVSEIECIVTDNSLFDYAYYIFVTSAMLSSALLLTLLGYAAYTFTGDEANCKPWIAPTALVLSTGPVIFAVLLFTLTYAIVRWRIWQLEKRHIDGVDYFRKHKSELETTVKPTPPVSKNPPDS